MNSPKLIRDHLLTNFLCIEEASKHVDLLANRWHCGSVDRPSAGFTAHPGLTVLKSICNLFSRSPTWKDTAVMGLIASINSRGSTKCSSQADKIVPVIISCLRNNFTESLVGKWKIELELRTFNGR